MNVSIPADPRCPIPTTTTGHTSNCQPTSPPRPFPPVPHIQHGEPTDPVADGAVGRVGHQVARHVDARPLPRGSAGGAARDPDPVPVPGGPRHQQNGSQRGRRRPGSAERRGRVSEGADEGDEGAQRHQEAVRALQGKEDAERSSLAAWPVALADAN